MLLKPHVVIVGGGAGGLELATHLAKKKWHLTLIDTSPTHLWKPLLHEVAAGTLSSYEDECIYLAFATLHRFEFCLGTLTSIDRTEKILTLAPMTENHIEIVPRRKLSYDLLVLAVGSISNDFGIEGVTSYCLMLDNRLQADYFQQVFVKHLTRIDYENRLKHADFKPLTIVVIGGGATGVELISELHSAISKASSCGMMIKEQDIRLVLIESNKRLLSSLPEAMSAWVSKQLLNLNIKIYLNAAVTKISALGVTLKSGEFIEADMRVWVAGIKAPVFLQQLDGLAVNTANQLLVNQSLQTTMDSTIFAFGDCASCPQGVNQPAVPPKAQAAHEQARFLVNALQQYINQAKLPVFFYKNRGSLVSLGQKTSIGILGQGQWIFQGKKARWAYLGLYKWHQIILYGSWRVFMLLLAHLFIRGVKPRFKCH